MSGYLSQIANAVPASSGSGTRLRPFVRSRSPIAQFDQRLSAEGWETPFTMEPAAPASETGDSVEDEPRLDGPARSRSRRNTVSSDRLLTEGAPGILSAPARTPAARPSLEPHSAEASETPGTSPTQAAASLPPRPAEPSRHPNVPHRREPSALKTRAASEAKDISPEFSSRSSSIERGMVAIRSESQRLASDTAAVPTPPVPAERERTAAPKIVATSTPKAVPAASTAIPRPSGIPGPSAPPPVTTPSRAPGPRVVIDRLQVEVIPPPPSKAGKSERKVPNENRHPSTGPQAVPSQIGPLNLNTSARHYLSIRHR